MLTYKQAVLARDSGVAVFAYDGMERTIVNIGPDYLYTENNYGEWGIHYLDELTPSRSLLALEAEQVWMT
jgi:hypothetical protein